MQEKKKAYPNPKFSSIAEEDKYWATHSPLDEGYTVDIQPEKQKRSSFLTIRLTGDELTRLRDLASSKGMGPSTLIRTLIKETITPRESAELALSKSAAQFESVMKELIYGNKAGGTSTVKDKAKERYEAIQDSFCILEPSRLPLTPEKLNDLTMAIIPTIYQAILNACVKVIAPSDSEFMEIKRITTERVGKNRK